MDKKKLKEQIASSSKNHPNQPQESSSIAMEMTPDTPLI